MRGFHVGDLATREIGIYEFAFRSPHCISEVIRCERYVNHRPDQGIQP